MSVIFTALWLIVALIILAVDLLLCVMLAITWKYGGKE